MTLAGTFEINFSTGESFVVKMKGGSMYPKTFGNMIYPKLFAQYETIVFFSGFPWELPLLLDER